MAKETIKIKPQLTFIDSYSARAASNEIEAIEDGNDLYFTLKTYGGTVWDGWEIATALQKFKGKTTIDIPGVSASMGIAVIAFADKNIASDKAKFMIHAPAGGDPKVISEIKKELYDVLSARIDEAKFKEITGKTLKQVIIPADGERLDIWLNAKEAKAIGLIDEIYKLDPKQRIAAEDDMIGHYQFIEYKETENNGVETPNINNKISKMNRTEFEAQHPALYAEICNAKIKEGKSLGATSNQARVDSFAEFSEIDAVLVAAKIKDPLATVDAAFYKEISATVKANALATGANNETEDELNTGQPKNDARTEAGKVDLTVIPEDVKAKAMESFNKLEMTESEINAELAKMASEYAPETKAK